MTAAQPSYEYYERPEMAPFVPGSTERLLDVGCSQGGFGAALRRSRRDIHLVGLEPDAAAAESARQHYDEVIVGHFPDAVPDDAAFDCVVFNDVLEHLVDPQAALQAAHGILLRGGCVIASIPNVRSARVVFDLVLRGRWDYADAGILDRTHLRFFTRSSIQRLFTDAGFEIENIAGLFPLGTRYRVAWLTRLLLRDLSYLEFAVVATEQR